MLKKLTIAAVAGLICIAAIRAVQATKSNPAASLRDERSLLLSEKSSMLNETQAREIYGKLDAFVARDHTVKSNEWLEKIAKELSVASIYVRSTNNLDDPVLHKGQNIILQNKPGMVHASRKDESLESVIKYYEKLGARKPEILEANHWDELTFMREGELYIKEGSLIWIPRARLSFPWLAMPVAARRISSRFGYRRHPVHRTKRFHDGYDMVAPYGSPVYAGQAGVVVFAGWKGGYGNVIEIRHSKISTVYGHLSKISVSEGQQVKRRQLIGRVGSTGLSTGPHLHLETRRNSDGKPINPGRYLY